MTYTKDLTCEFTLPATEDDVMVAEDFGDECFAVEAFGQFDGRQGVGCESSLGQDLESKFFGAVAGVFGDLVVPAEDVFDAFIDHGL